MFWLFFIQFRFGPKALRLLKVLLRNRPRWKKAMLWAHWGRRSLQGPAVMSRSQTSLSSLSAPGTGTGSLSFSLSLTAAWTAPWRSKTSEALDVVRAAAAATYVSAGAMTEMRE